MPKTIHNQSVYVNIDSTDYQLSGNDSVAITLAITHDQKYAQDGGGSSVLEKTGYDTADQIAITATNIDSDVLNLLKGQFDADSYFGLRVVDNIDPTKTIEMPQANLRVRNLQTAIDNTATGKFMWSFGGRITRFDE